MATKIGPKTVSQRDRSKALVFCIDAAHSDSYGGEPTTNLLQYPESIGSGPTQEGWSGTITANAVTAPDGTQTATKIVATSGHVYERLYIDTSYNGATFTTGDTITYSIWVKTLDGTATTSKGPHIWNYNSPTYGIVGQDLSGIGPEWKLFKVTHTVAAHQTNFAFAYSSSVSNGLTGLTYAIWHPQLEVKSNSTPYVKTSRTASNAVKNISGVGALGTTLTGTFAAYGQQLFKPGRRVLASLDANKGHIGGAHWDLAGDDECIVIPYDDNSSLNLARGTIIVWFNASGGAQNGTIVGWGSAGTDNYGNIAITSNWTGAYADESLAYNRWRSGVTSQIQMYIRKGHNFYADSTWHCVAVTSHGGASDLGRIYIDGELQTITTTSNTEGSHPFMNLKDSTAKFLNIGRRPYGGGANYFNGEIANTMIWSSSLTSKEIKDIYIAQKGRFGK